MIRQATLEDRPVLVALARDMHAESNYAPVAFSEERVEQFISWLCTHRFGYVAVAQGEHAINGFLLAMAVPPWFGDGKDMIADELVLYVAPNARHGRAALGLVDALKAWAVRLGVKQLRAGVSAGAAGLGAGRLYEHVGFECTGGCYLLDFTRDAQRAAA